MSRSRRALAAVLLAALIVLAGCSGGGGGGGGAADLGATQAADRSAEEAPAESGGSGGSGDSAGDALQISQRQVIKTGRVVLTVDDYGRARRNLSRAARGMDGFVSDSTRRRHEVRGGTYVTGSVTLRVPNERFGAMMDRAESAGTVEHSETNSKDVTDQLVDIEARLTNLRQQRERLRTLYERANDTEDVLAVQRRLSETQERIERLEAKQRTLERRVAYSTITVELNEERPEPGPEEIQQWYDVPLVGAFLESVHGVTVVARAIAVLAAYALPYLLAFLGPVGLVTGLAVRRYRRGGDGDGDGVDGDDGGDEPPDEPADAGDGPSDTADGGGEFDAGDGSGSGDGGGGPDDDPDHDAAADPDGANGSDGPASIDRTDADDPDGAAE